MTGTAPAAGRARGRTPAIDSTSGIEPQVRIAALPLYTLVGAIVGSIGLLLTGAAAPTVLADSGPLGR